MTQQKIVHIAEAFGGGVLSMLTHLANHAAATGVDVTVLHSIRSETPTDFSTLFLPGVKLVYVDMAREVSVKQDLRSVRALVRHLRDCKPTAIHLHSSKAGVLGRIAARIATPNAKVLYSPHGLSFLRRDVSRMKQYAYLSFERIAAHIGGTIVACSGSELAEIRGKVRAKSTVLVENGVDVAEIPPRRMRDDRKVVIGMSGRASYQKNHHAFVRLADMLHDTDVEFLWIGGNAAEIPDPGQRGAVVCSGWIPRARALALTSELDIYVQTSRWEGMPVALIEAQVAGIPAVVTDVVGNRDVVIHGVTGYVASNAAEMAAYLTTLRDDRQLREQMGAAARKRAIQRFSMNAIFRQWNALYGLDTEEPRVDTRDFKPVAPDHVKA
ncbi:MULTISPECIES: glycosyltransferase [Burkholderia]|uniref:glycosyltransferase n=1 Tax=Burkholderia TaxID=32008 RepID=UPI000B7A0877|nr:MULTISPECIES: glycosyltransferase [Burkholderia]MBY4726702.1 glycosyltransferase [Burkholderia contaminans]MCI3969350.1 glycosyltransferase [Burkholderia sp. HI4860]MDN7787312.1 glycosyltransferase [Burkholderia contaminans]OXI98577.1 glycosyl transferase [Burkholderia sp. AU33647]